MTSQLKIIHIIKRDVNHILIEKMRYVKEEMNYV
jgi:hypothetical protein